VFKKYKNLYSDRIAISSKTYQRWLYHDDITVQCWQHYEESVFGLHQGILHTSFNICWFLLRNHYTCVADKRGIHCEASWHSGGKRRLSSTTRNRMVFTSEYNENKLLLKMWAIYITVPSTVHWPAAERRHVQTPANICLHLTWMNQNTSIRYNTRCYFNVCARKPTWVSLIYRTEPTTKKCKTEKLKK